jgi:hypothetical protein
LVELTKREDAAVPPNPPAETAKKKEQRPAHKAQEEDPFAPDNVVVPKKTELPELTIENTKSYPNEECQASIVQILAHRDRYHGKHVQIDGYLLVRPEATALYLCKEHADYLMTRNGLWVTFDKRAVPYQGVVGPTRYDRTYVLIEGTFDKNSLGHMGAYQGTIANVTRVVELTKRK